MASEPATFAERVIHHVLVYLLVAIVLLMRGSACFLLTYTHAALRSDVIWLRFDANIYADTAFASNPTAHYVTGSPHTVRQIEWHKWYYTTVRSAIPLPRWVVEDNWDLFVPVCFALACCVHSLAFRITNRKRADEVRSRKPKPDETVYYCAWLAVASVIFYELYIVFDIYTFLLVLYPWTSWVMEVLFTALNFTPLPFRWRRWIYELPDDGLMQGKTRDVEQGKTEDEKGDYNQVNKRPV